MGSVGLNFGSASAGTGFDVGSAVSAILSVQSAIEDPWKAQLTHLKAQDAAFTGIGSDLSSLSTALSSLTNFDGLFTSKQGSSSNTNVLALTSAGLGSVAGSHTVVVTSLAQTSSQYSANIANAGDTLSGSLTLQVGSGAPQTINLDSSNNTLAKLAASINNGSYGVSASVVSSTAGFRLSLVSSTSGAAGEIAVTPGLTDTTTSAPVAFQAGQTGVDAQLNVDGLDTTSASNTVTGAIPGVTFQLLAASTAPVQVQVTNDTGSIQTAAQTFVSAYNKVIKDMKAQEGNDATGAANPLYGNSTIGSIQNQLASALYSGGASGSISSIVQLGITAQQDGTLTLDSNALGSKLNTNFNDVAGFFWNANAFGQTMSSALDNLGTGPSGTIAMALLENSGQETTLNKNVSDQDARIAAQKITLTNELNTANQILQSIPQQLTSVNEIYSATTGYNTK